jgi:hypothetical protein
VILGGVLVGGPAGTAVTVIVNAASGTLTLPSLTLTTMFEYAPTFEVAGVPLRSPVVVLNDAQDGLSVMENTSEFPSASCADGWKA